jgi:chromosome segregation ATPase
MALHELEAWCLDLRKHNPNTVERWQDIAMAEHGIAARMARERDEATQRAGELERDRDAARAAREVFWHRMSKAERERDEAQKRIAELEAAIKQYLDDSGCEHPVCHDSDGVPVLACGEEGLCRALYAKGGA